MTYFWGSRDVRQSVTGMEGSKLAKNSVTYFMDGLLTSYPHAHTMGTEQPCFLGAPNEWLLHEPLRRCGVPCICLIVERA